MLGLVSTEPGDEIETVNAARDSPVNSEEEDNLIE